MNEIKTENIKKEKKVMSQSEVFELIDKWGDELEVRLMDEDWEDVKKEIWKAVQMDRLTYDSADEKFIYVLKSPIEDRTTGQPVISMIQIRETQMCNKRGMIKQKDDIDTVAAMFAAYCTDSGGNEIQHGFLTRIYDRDQAIISAVILGFFVQAVPSRKSVR
jgi:hypothetical protein